MTPRAVQRAGAWLALALSVGAVAGPSSPAVAGDDPYAKVLAQRAADLRSRAFHRRTVAWRALAATHDARALQLFATEYDRAFKEPQVRAFLASTACDAFGAAGDLPALCGWRDLRLEPDDAWLWYRVGLREVEHGAAAGVLARLRDPKLAAPLRGASLLALAAWADPSVLDAIPAVLDAAPPADRDRGLLVETCAWALRSQAGRWGSPAYVRVARRLADLIADPKAPERSRLLLGRVFAHAAGLPRPLRSVAGWRLLLEGAAEASIDDEGRRYAPPVAFMDVVTTGHRIGFVVDASGSMDSPLTPTELDDLRPAEPRVGTPADAPRGREGPRPGAPPKPGAEGLIEVRLRWERIRSRYDAALEFVRAAVARLGDDVRFASVLFGTRAEELVRGQGLATANRPNLAGITKAVDARLAGGGTLGATNLHGGIVRIFRTDEKGVRLDASPLDPILLRDGVDTVYVLSDGAPSTDDWDDDSAAVFRPEGTYADDAQLLDDVDRWNLFRHAEIDVVRIGDEAGDLLEQLAWRNGGVFRPIPRPAPKPDVEVPAPGADPKGKAAADDPAALVQRLGSDVEADRRRAARALDRLAGRRWGFTTGMRAHERTALQRNWAWWLELHPPKPAPTPAAPGATPTPTPGGR